MEVEGRIKVECVEMGGGEGKQSGVSGLQRGHQAAHSREVAGLQSQALCRMD